MYYINFFVCLYLIMNCFFLFLFRFFIYYFFIVYQLLIGVLRHAITLLLILNILNLDWMYTLQRIFYNKNCKFLKAQEEIKINYIAFYIKNQISRITEMGNIYSHFVTHTNINIILIWQLHRNSHYFGVIKLLNYWLFSGAIQIFQCLYSLFKYLTQYGVS